MLLVKEGRMASAHPVQGGGGERRKREHPGGITMSRATAETRAVVMTYIRGFSSFGLTASKDP